MSLQVSIYLKCSLVPKCTINFVDKLVYIFHNTKRQNFGDKNTWSPACSLRQAFKSGILQRVELYCVVMGLYTGVPKSK